VNTALIYGTILWLFSVGVYQGNKPLPHGLNYTSDIIYADTSGVELLVDLTSVNSVGDTVQHQEIFDSLFTYIEQAEKYILIDMFLFNQYTGPSGFVYRNITLELQEKLIQQKQKYPDLQIDFITDPVNVFYGGSIASELEALKANGINVIITDLRKIRDSAPIYSSIWRTFIQWFGNSNKYGILPNPFDAQGQKVTFRSYFDFLNLKANHRKVCIVDSPEGPVSFVMSANPHSASSDFSNVAVMFRGAIAQQLYETEKTVAEMSGSVLHGEKYLQTMDQVTKPETYAIQVITEQQIKDRLLANIDDLVAQDTLFIAMFYFSNRDVINSLVDASKRGVIVKIILDPNKDGFGFYRSGIPNQVIAGELLKRSKNKISIKWYHTRGEEFHTKLALTLPKEKKPSVILGSSNYTRKNLNNYNLELDVVIDADRSSPLITETSAYFDKLWLNTDNIYTTDYEQFAHTSLLRTLQYRFQEYTGLGVY
jgi:phosphatidylserine/phosphatidylglycerophosphate/cardiolipin synthase-like enzyme